MVCYNDEIARKLCEMAAAEWRKGVPEDFSLVRFDTLSWRTFGGDSIPEQCGFPLGRSDKTAASQMVDRLEVGRADEKAFFSAKTDRYAVQF